MPFRSLPHISVLVVLAGHCLSCASLARAPNSDATTSPEGVTADGRDSDTRNEPQELPVPSDLQDGIHQAEELGATLFVLDYAVASGQDAVHVELGIDRQKPLPGVVGWVTSRSDDEVRVDFVGGGKDALVALYRSALPVAGGPPIVEILEEPEPLDSSAAGQIWAIQTAMKQPFRRCSAAYNPIVAPASAIGEEGWLVYMMAASTRTNEAHLVGHHRFLISGDGKSVLRHDALSKSCLNFEWPAAEPPMVFHLSHIVSEVPGEIYVFANLLYKIPINILAVDRREVWMVHDGRYHYFGDAEEFARK